MRQVTAGRPLRTSKSGGRTAAVICYSAAVAALGLLLMHPDLMETSNHSYVMLDCIFSGRFLDFYKVVAEHQNTLYYINGANYSALFYIVYAVWELPLWLINTALSLPVNEGVLWLWAKGPGIICLLLCGLLSGKIAGELGADARGARWAVLLNPVLLLFAAGTGHYDTLCLSLMLLALLFILRGRTMAFCAVMGAAVCFKFFALLAFIPMLLLLEKKIWRILSGLLLGLAPYGLLTLLFWGRTADSGFTGEMLARLTEIKVGDIPLFEAAYVVICLVAWLWRSDAPGGAAKAACACAAAVYGSLLLFTTWHPQWSVLLVPFWVILASCARNKKLYYYLSLAFSAGVLLYSWIRFSGQFELNTLFYGVLYPSGLSAGLIYLSYPSVNHVLSNFASIQQLLRGVVYAAVAAIFAAYLPLQPGSPALADRWGDGEEGFSLPLLWLCLGLCLAAFFAVPALQLVLSS